MTVVEIRLNPVAFVLVAFLGLLSIQYLFGWNRETWPVNRCEVGL